MNTTKQNLDLNKVRDTVIENIDVLLDELNIDYEIKNNSVFMPCPIHGGDNPNGLSISLDHKKWKCWTHSCQDDFGNDIFGFVRGYRQDPTFSETLGFICRLYDINKSYSKKVEVKVEKTELEEIVRIFKQKPKQMTENNYVRDVETLNNSFYFEKRGFLPDTLSHFGVKDCIDKTSSMWNRAIIPVTFENKEVGYIARAVKNFIQPKYLFSNGFKKTDYLYNYDNAIDVARDKHTLFLVEGQGDVWRMYEAGVVNCVGLFGKDLSDTQKSLLIRSGVTDLVVLTDNDQAGREGRMKIQRELNRMFNLIYPPMLKKDIGDTSIKKIQKHILPHVEGLF
jgi:DNA primase